jgi:LasA protease
MIPTKVNIHKIDLIKEKSKYKFSHSKRLKMTGTLFASITLSVSAIAGPHLYENKNAQNNDVIFSSDLVSRPISNELFLYGQDASNFDLEYYLSNNAPILLEHQEIISHWSGYYSINPKVVIALMELSSTLISDPDQTKLSTPFEALSNKTGFSEQLQDVLFTLSTHFYQYEQSQLLLKQDNANRRLADQTSAMYSATAALNSLEDKLKPSLKSRSLSTNTLSNKLAKHFSQLFGQDMSALSDQTQQSQAMQVSASSPPMNMMQLPWRIGYSWKSNGAHSHTGSGYPYSSIDVSYDWPDWGQATYSVTAAHNGTVNVLSRCQVRVTHSNGWATNYYHMDNIEVSNGQYVDANTKLGIYANNRNTALCEGGSSTGPHLHFSLLNNGRYVSLQGVNFGEFRINVGNYNYDNSCNRFYFTTLNSNGYQCAWSAMYNSGTY